MFDRSVEKISSGFEKIVSFREYQFDVNVIKLGKFVRKVGQMRVVQSNRETVLISRTAHEDVLV